MMEREVDGGNFGETEATWRYKVRPMFDGGGCEREWG